MPSLPRQPLDFRVSHRVLKSRFHTSASLNPSHHHHIVGAAPRSQSQLFSFAQNLKKAIRSSVLVEQLGVSLVLPVPNPISLSVSSLTGGAFASTSDVGVFTLSAALRFRQGLPPLGLNLSSPSPSRPNLRSFAMLLDDKQSNDDRALHVQNDAQLDTSAATPAAIPASPTSPRSSKHAEASAHAAAHLGTADIPPAYSKTVPMNERTHNTPQYLQHCSSSSSSSFSAPANYVHIYKRDGSISGQWNIDPTMVVPPMFMPPKGGEDAKDGIWTAWNKRKEQATAGSSTEVKAKEKEEVVEEGGEKVPSPNLKLHTRDGKITADVLLSSKLQETSPTTNKPTLIDLYTRDGGIVFRLRSRGPPSTPIHINAHTHDGTMRIFLPRDFTGLISHKLHDGRLVPSSAMLQQHPHPFTTFSNIDRQGGKSFLGDWRSLTSDSQPTSPTSPTSKEAAGGLAAAGMDEESWKGDHCDVSSRDGSIYFYWEDEYDEVMANLGPKAWLKSLFSH